jgi:hypothetical protein
VGVEDATKPTEALKESVDADFRDVADRLYDVESRVERLERSTPAAKPEE